VRFSSPLIPGRFRRRYQRFLADVELESGELITAHCANPGSMKSCLEPHGRVWLSRSPNATRKLPYTWEIAEAGGALIYVNPAGANGVVAEALTQGRIPELAGYGVRREVATGEGSRIDFLLERDSERAWVEVKNVTLGLGAGRAAFPDAVTARGKKHLGELERLARAGARAVAFFCVARDDAHSFEPAVEIDREYATELRRVAKRGVELIAYRCAISLDDVSIEQRLEVRV
jgi:sugar fermentation stimulation protein A